MTPATAHAPIYTRAHDLARWLLAHLPGEGPLTRRMQHEAIDLLDGLVLALADRDRAQHLARADDQLRLLRAHVRLAHDIELLDAAQVVFLAEQLDDIGRQLGGWRRHLDGDRVGPRHRSSR